MDEEVAGSDEGYWVDRNAALPVLLIDDATQSITEALHRVRSGSALDNRDLAAAEVALGDLFGGLGQLADLLAESCRPVSQRRFRPPCGVSGALS